MTKLKRGEIFCSTLAVFLNDTEYGHRWTGGALLLEQLEQIMTFDPNLVMPMNPHLIYPLKWLNEFSIVWKAESEYSDCQTARQLFDAWEAKRVKSP